MGHIKEPKGVDFIIKSGPLTDEDRKAISEFIRRDKAKQTVRRKSKSSAKKKQVA